MPCVKIIHKTLYSFKELLDQEWDGITSSAVEKARYWLQQGTCCDSFWYECIIDDWKEALDQIGFPDAEIQFEGFHHQGQGASFTSGVVMRDLLEFVCAPIRAKSSIEPFADDPGKEDWRPWLLHKIGETGPYAGDTNARRFRRLIPLAGDSLYGGLRRTGYRGVHESSVRLDVEFHDTRSTQTRLNRLVNDLEECLEELRRDLCYAIFTSLRDEYEYRMSDEALMEDAEANGWTFDEDGNRE